VEGLPAKQSLWKVILFVLDPVAGHRGEP